MFAFKQFRIDDTRCGMKVSTDAVILGAWAFRGCDPRQIVDLGCGSGLLSLMMAQRFPDASVIGLEIDADAAADARANVDASPFDDMVSIRVADVMAIPEGQLRADCIISNPPFFSEQLRSPDEARSLARHGRTEDAFHVLSLIRIAARYGSENARLALMFPTQRIEEVSRELTLHRWHLTARMNVAPREGRNPNRTYIEASRTFAPEEYFRMAIRTADGVDFTHEYQSLTSPFYLNFNNAPGKE